jgi:hypothetical protein
MALRKLDRSFAPITKEIRYLQKDFGQWRQSLIDFAKVYFPNTYSDFNESSPGMMFIEMASYVGDVLSYYIDTQFRENLIQYAEEQDNIIAIAQAMGYRPKPGTAAQTELDFYQLCPATSVTSNYVPDTNYMLRLAANTVVASTEFGSVKFRTSAEVNFADPADREITVYSTTVGGVPSMYLIRKTVRVQSGEIKTFEASFGSPEKFSKIVIPETDVLEVISLIDSNGHTWHEVDYLAQDLVLDGRVNSNPTVSDAQSTAPAYTMRITRTPRRFVTRYDPDFNFEIHFGSGTLDDSDALINLEPSKIVSDEYQQSLASTSLDPSDFLSSRSYGLAPSNVTMTVKYVTGGGLESNVPSGTINKIETVEVLNDSNSMSLSEQALLKDVIASLAVNNPEPATGGKGTESVEEIRQNALAFFNSQNRAVNVADYTVRAYAMPPKFGGAAKVFVAEDSQINGIQSAVIGDVLNLPDGPIQTLNNAVNLVTNNLTSPSTVQMTPNGTLVAVPSSPPPTNESGVQIQTLAPVVAPGADAVFVNDPAGQNIINLYVLGYNQNKKLVNLNDDVKKNLRMYIDQYRILTDEVRILDGFVVNIGVNFEIITFRDRNMNEVLARCISAIANFFDIDRWALNQPIVVADLFTEIASVEGVQSVSKLEIVNKYRFKDGGDYNDYIYDLPSATMDGVIYPSLDPCIFELRYPENDIVGAAKQ